MSLKTIVTFAGYQWETGKQLLDVEVTLGSADKSSSCRVSIADPMHYIAAAIINHSQIAGGIQALPDTNKAPSVVIPGAKSEGAPVTSTIPGNGTVAKGAGFTPQVKAFLDTVAKRETDTPNGIRGYYQNNGVSGSKGQFTDADILQGGGFPASGKTAFNVGRYQFNRGDWQEAKGKVPAIKGFSPLDQDLVAYSKIMNNNRGGKELLAGDIVAALTKAGNEWASIPFISSIRPQNSISQIQPGTTKQEYLDYYKQRLAYHQGASGGQQSTVKATPPVKPAAPNAVNKPLASTAPQAQPVIKGSPLTIQIGNVFYEFLHQGTELSEAGITILVGQGIRWIMSRRKRSATYKDISLKQLAEKVAKEHKVTLDYQATKDLQYSHIDQSGISDYQLLLRETDANGLLMTETKTAIVIKERAQLKDSKLVLSRGVNLISYKISDKAVGTHDDEISKLLPQTAKTVIDPIAGKVKSVIKDVDRNADAAKPTGISKPATTGTLKAGEVTQIKERAATKRIAGLPSTFVVPLTLDTLGVEPTTTAVTEGLPGVLDRLWVVKKITHSLAANTTTLEMVSPVEVLDANPSGGGNIKGIKPEAGGSVKSIGFIYPVSGSVSSLQSPNRNGRPHNGADIAAASGTPIYAVAAGVCAANQFQPGKAGNYCTIAHDGGLFTNYFHQLSPALPAVGQKVKQGELIGYVGTTGGSTGPHLHLEVLSSISPPRRLNVATYFPKLGKELNSIIANTKAS